MFSARLQVVPSDGGVEVIADIARIDGIERSKRRNISLFCLSAGVFLLLLAVRFIPWLNDALSGKPEYLRVLTESFARQIAAQTEMQAPVIVEHDEHGTCDPVGAPSISEAQIRGTIYLLTYSEQQRLTCFTTYIVLADASGLSNLRNFRPGEGKNYGPSLLGNVKARAETRVYHVYPAEYLKRLHWRYQPHFPIPQSEAESLRSETRYSGGEQAEGTVQIDFDYGALRQEVAIRHRKVNLALSLLLVGSGVLLLLLAQRIWQSYRAMSRYGRLYDFRLTPRTFIKEDLGTWFACARREYFERQQQTQAQLRERERLRALKGSWQEGLRSAVPNLADEGLRQRVEECLEQEPQDWEQLKSLWIEVQERSTQKSPTDKLNLLLESTREYCSEEEFLACQTEALAILSKSGFRAARTFAISAHEQFKLRARELDELQGSEPATQ